MTGGRKNPAELRVPQLTRAPRVAGPVWNELQMPATRASQPTNQPTIKTQSSNLVGVQSRTRDLYPPPRERNPSAKRRRSGLDNTVSDFQGPFCSWTASETRRRRGDPRAGGSLYVVSLSENTTHGSSGHENVQRIPSD